MPTYRRTHDQRTAEQELASALPGYHVTADPEGWPMAPGRHGRLEHLGNGQFAAYTDRRLIRSRLLAIPGARAHQTGDSEVRALVSRQAAPTVADLLRCRRRRRAPANPFRARDSGAPSVQEASEGAGTGCRA
jgi:hypothetical protein